jgi:DNA-binding IclR family transcriptional regulator
MQHKTDFHKSLQKGLEILLAFAPDNQEMGTNEISRRFGIHKSTASRMLQVLRNHNFLYRDTNTRKYRLGNSAAIIGRAVIRSLSDQVVAIAQPYMDKLRSRIGESIALEVLSGTTTILACRARGSQAVHVSLNLGDRLPIHVAAGSKAILAYSDKAFVEGLLKKRLERFTSHTITDPRIFLKQLAKIKDAGIAYDRGEHHADIYGVGAPIFNYDKKPIAAVVIGVPAQRKEYISVPEVVAQLKKCANAISNELLYSEMDNQDFEL